MGTTLYSFLPFLKIIKSVKCLKCHIKITVGHYYIMLQLGSDFNKQADFLGAEKVILGIKNVEN